MPLEAPRLDDRSYRDIIEEALRRIPQYCPEWTDFNPSDPGITIIELFAWMTDMVLYRLNRVPEKHFVKFMELIGMQRREPQAAQAGVTFILSKAQPNTITIPAGTEVATIRTEMEPAIVFTTDYDADIHVPERSQLLVSYVPEGQRRLFSEAKMRDEGFAMFPSEGAPQPDDALYLGFEHDLSHHVLALDVQVVAASGSGISTDRPPYVWEVSSIAPEATQGWLRADVDQGDDKTRGFNQDGRIIIHLPKMQRDSYGDSTRSAFWLRCRLPSPAETDGNTYESSPRIRNLAVSSIGITVNVTNVTMVENEILGRSDGTPSQHFFLAHTPVAPRQAGEQLLVVYPDNSEERWQEVPDFADSGVNDLHYTLDSVNGEIHLAPALRQQDGSIRSYGAVPPKNSLLIMRRYRHGGGYRGNVGAKSLNVCKTSLPYVSRVTNRRPARGGLDVEGMDDLKLRVPGHLRSLGRAVTADDYQQLAMQAAPGEVGRVHCISPSASRVNGRAGVVRVLVVPRVPNLQDFIEEASLQLSPHVRDVLKTYLDERSLVTTEVEIVQPRYHWVSANVVCRIRPRYDRESVREEILWRLYTYLNPLIGGEDGRGWSFGRALQETDVRSCLAGTEGLDFIRWVELFETSRPDPTVFATASDHVEVSPEGVIASYRHEISFE